MQPLRLLRPIEPLIVAQGFGENLTCVDVESGTKVVSRAAGAQCLEGYESLYERAGMFGHDGLDLRAEDGQEIVAACEGIVRELVDEPERGKGMGVVSEDAYLFADGAYHAKTRYWHLKSFAVELGHKVRPGELIGYADNTGLSSGTHLHFELKPVRRRHTGFENVLQDNGYFGAVDPSSYFIDE